MQTFAVIALLVGSALGSPHKLDDLVARSAGYRYDPPEVPALYEVPEPPTTTTTTTTTTTPPPPPPPSYLPPDTNEEVPPPPPPPKEMMLMPYEFSYGVDDPESGSQFKHAVNSDGQHVEGEYSVMLPDGRMQVVKFTSDPDTGYVADVSYLK